MAYEIHTEEAATTKGPIALVLTYNESPEHPGLTRRYSGLMSAAMMVAYIFKGRTRHAIRVLSEAEKAEYQLARAKVFAGEGI